MVEDYLTADDFEGLSGDGLAEACLACSARFSPMFAAFATRSGPRDYDDLVRDLWACAGREVSAREAEEFERRIEAFPEADCDDSYLLDYYAMSVMGIPFEALHVLAGGGVERALACSELALELLGGFRVLLGDEKSELWDAERQEQLRVIAGLRPAPDLRLLPGLTGLPQTRRGPARNRRDTARGAGRIPGPYPPPGIGETARNAEGVSSERRINI